MNINNQLTEKNEKLEITELSKEEAADFVELCNLSYDKFLDNILKTWQNKWIKNSRYNTAYNNISRALDQKDEKVSAQIQNFYKQIANSFKILQTKLAHNKKTSLEYQQSHQEKQNDFLKTTIATPLAFTNPGIWPVGTTQVINVMLSLAMKDLPVSTSEQKWMKDLQLEMAKSVRDCLQNSQNVYANAINFLTEVGNADFFVTNSVVEKYFWDKNTRQTLDKNQFNQAENKPEKSHLLNIFKDYLTGKTEFEKAQNQSQNQLENVKRLENSLNLLKNYPSLCFLAGGILGSQNANVSAQNLENATQSLQNLTEFRKYFEEFTLKGLQDWNNTAPVVDKVKHELMEYLIQHQILIESIKNLKFVDKNEQNKKAKNDFMLILYRDITSDFKSNESKELIEKITLPEKIKYKLMRWGIVTAGAPTSIGLVAGVFNGVKTYLFPSLSNPFTYLLVAALTSASILFSAKKPEKKFYTIKTPFFKKKIWWKIWQKPQKNPQLEKLKQLYGKIKPRKPKNTVMKIIDALLKGKA